MYREDFIKYLETTGLHYDANPKGFVDDYDGIYIYGIEWFEKQAHPSKCKNLFVRYLRVSNFGGMWYVRDCGMTGYMSVPDVMERIEELKRKE